MHDIFRIRRATVQDVEIIAWHRARMFQDMGDVSDDGFEILRTKARLRLKEWLESGDYIGWLATPADKPETVVGGAGVQLQPILPRPLDASTIGDCHVHPVCHFPHHHVSFRHLSQDLRIGPQYVSL